MESTAKLIVAFTVSPHQVPEAPVGGFQVTYKYSIVDQEHHNEHRIQGEKLSEVEYIR